MAIVAEFNDLTLNPSPNSDEMDPNQRCDLLKSIKNVGYDETLLSENQLSTALTEGPKSVEYTKLVNFLANELREICGLDEHINTISAPEDSSTFVMETSSFLHELGCPYERLVQGPVSDRLNTVEDRYLLVKYLISELVAARILRENQPGKRLDLKLKESEQASDLRKILQILGYPQPPKNITMQLLLKKLVPSLQNLIAKAPKDLIGGSIFSGTLSEAQWEKLENVNQDLHDEYSIRREMLLKRLDCTIQSFQWSGKTKGKDGKVERDYGEKRKLLTSEPEIGIADLLAARDDVAIIEKTSSAAVRKHTKSSINRVIIGAVPDRGGRTSEQAPPPPEMPPWQQRNAGPMGGGGGGRGGRGGNFARGGGSSFSQGGGFSRGGGGAGNFSQGNYESTRTSFDSAGSYGSSQGDNSRGGGTSSYSRGGYSNNRGSFDSAGSYGDTSRGYSQSGSNYSGGLSRDNNGSSRDNQSYSRDSNSGYSRGGGYSQGGNSGYSRDGGYSQGGNSGYSSSSGYSRDSGYSQDNSGYSRDNNTGYSGGSGGYSQTGYSKGFDSAGSYGGQPYQEPKRAKTFDQFQQSKSTYADQYVQESQHNQQYQSRGRDNRGGGGRGGRSDYNRGGGGGSYR